MRVSVETIYRWICGCRDGRYKLSPFTPGLGMQATLAAKLVMGQGRRVLPGRIDIGERPEIVAKRARWRLGGRPRLCFQGQSGTGLLAMNVKAVFCCWPRWKTRQPPHSMARLLAACSIFRLCSAKHLRLTTVRKRPDSRNLRRQQAWSDLLLYATITPAARCQ